MNKVARLFEEEKWEAVKKVELQKQREEKKVMALQFMLKGKSLDEVQKASGLSLEELEELRR